MKFSTLGYVSGVAILGSVLSSCSVGGSKPVVGIAAPTAVAVAKPDFGPVIDETGACTAVTDFNPAPYRGKPDDALVGLGECQIVKIHGEPPLSVMTGASAQSKRETTILYMESSGKAVYLFSNNRLVRVVR